MNQAFFTLLTNRLTALTAGLLLYHKPTGVKKPPQIIGTMLDRPTGAVEEGQEYPFVRWVIYNGEFATMGPTPFSVMIDGGIYTPGSIANGNSDITVLTLALGRIVDEPWFSPYKLRNRVPFILGSPEENSRGIQPHPYYFTRLHLDFVVARGHGG